MNVFIVKKKGHRVADCYVFQQDIDDKRIDPHAYAHMTQRRSSQYQQMSYQHPNSQYQHSTQRYQNPTQYQPYPTNQFQPSTAGPAPQVTSRATQGNGTPLLPTYSVAAVQQNTQSAHVGGASSFSRPSVSFSDPLAQTMPSYTSDASMHLADLMGPSDASNQVNDAKS